MIRLLPSATTLRDLRVLVVGDVMLDRYIQGRVVQVSQEAPVPVLNVDGTSERLGGAANVASNVVALGARCTLVAAVGDDPSGAAITRMIDAAGIDADLVVVPGWRTTLKERIVSGRKQMLRMDFEDGFEEEVAAQVARRAATHLRNADSLVLEDYDKGALACPQQIVRAARDHGVPAVADPKLKPLAAYRGVDVFKPNRWEFQQAAGHWQDDAELNAVAARLARENGIGAIALTLGDQGLRLVESNGRHCHLPSVAADVFDSTGAGDTVAATLGVCVALGWSRAEAANAANVAGGLVCAKFGTATVSLLELNRAIEERDGHADATDLLPRSRLANVVDDARRQGERIVFTNGCFDILHAGHVGYLAEARALGDRLVVAVNDDESARRLKGEGRPVNPLQRRMRVLEGLSAVDWVVPFSEDTPEALLAEIRPDVLVKGGDYALADVVGADFVRGYGGEVRVLSRAEGCSTTMLLEYAVSSQCRTASA